MTKYVDQRGTIFTLSGVTGHVINGLWDFKVISNDIESKGELMITHSTSDYNDTKLINTFKGVKVYDGH